VNSGVLTVVTQKDLLPPISECRVPNRKQNQLLESTFTIYII